MVISNLKLHLLRFPEKAAFALALALACSSSYAVQQYQLTLLPSLKAYAINNQGTVVGTQQVNNSNGFSWSNGTVTYLHSFGGTASATSINDLGVVAGVATDQNNRQYAVTWQGGSTPINLGWPNSDPRATAINDAGTVVGFNNFDALKYNAGTLTTLPQGPNYKTYTLAEGINDSGTIVGYGDFGSSNGNYQAQVWAGNTVAGLPSLPNGLRSKAFAINNNGQIAGWSDNGAGLYAGHAVIWGSDGSPTDLGLAGGTDSFALAINMPGDAVGYADALPSAFATLYTGGNSYNLNNLLINPVAGEYLTRADGINDHGVIVGYTSKLDGFILTPVPEPASVTLLAIAAIPLLTRRRIHRSLV